MGDRYVHITQNTTQLHARREGRDPETALAGEGSGCRLVRGLSTPAPHLLPVAEAVLRERGGGVWQG